MRSSHQSAGRDSISRSTQGEAKANAPKPSIPLPPAFGRERHVERQQDALGRTVGVMDDEAPIRAPRELRQPGAVVREAAMIVVAHGFDPAQQRLRLALEAAEPAPDRKSTRLNSSP